MKKLWGRILGVLIASMLYSSVYAQEAIIYCHLGFGTPFANMTTDVEFYARNGFEVFEIQFSDEIGYPAIASMDVQIITEKAEELISRGYTVNLVGVSLGGYRALQAFIRNPHLFNKVVAMMSPINVTREKDLTTWMVRKTEEEIQMAMTFFSELETPIQLCKQGLCDGLSDRILLIWGGIDELCPKDDCYLMAAASGAECQIVRWASHNVSNFTRALWEAIEFLRE